MATQRAYLDPNGNAQIGYIIDNKTYKDELGTTRIDIGSTVKGDDGTVYKMTENGGVVVPPETIQPYTSVSDKYTNDIYDAYNETTKQALDSVYQQNVNTLNNTKAGIPQTYQDARNSTAAQSETQRANFNEYAAASGLNSGTGGQAQLAFSNTLQSNLSGLDREQAKAISDIDLQITNLTVQSKADIAKALAAGNLEKSRSLLDNYNTEIARLDALKQQREAMALSAAQYSGIFDAMAAYGWTQEQIIAAHEKWLRDNT